MRQTWAWRAGSGGELGWWCGAGGTWKEVRLHCKNTGWGGSSSRAELSGSSSFARWPLSVWLKTNNVQPVTIAMVWHELSWWWSRIFITFLQEGDGCRSGRLWTICLICTETLAPAAVSEHALPVSLPGIPCPHAKFFFHINKVKNTDQP